MTLKHPSPSRIDSKRLVVRCSDINNPKNLQIMIWAAEYAARKYIEAILKGHDWSQVDDQTIIADNGYKIVMFDGMSDVLEHEYTSEENAWELRGPNLQAVRIFRGEDLDDAPANDNNDQKKPKPSPPAKTKPRRKPAKRKDGMSTVADIANSVGISPSRARAFLRKQMPKPDQGWCWEDPEPIVELLQKLK